MAINSNGIAPIGVGVNPLTNTIWERGFVGYAVAPIPEEIITTESGIDITTESGIELTTEP